MTYEINNRQNGGAAKRIGLWMLKGLIALVFVAAAYLKLSGSPKMVAEFGEIGLGQGFRYLTGLIEGGGALALLWPRTSLLGAATLLGVCAGALAAQVFKLHHDVIHVFVLGGLVVLAGALTISSPK